MAEEKQELDRRNRIWATLKNENIADAQAQRLRQLGAYGGAQGIWVDKERTSYLAKDGVTVGILHTGRHYPDDLSEDGLIYHYPQTSRPQARDAAEIQATKNSQQLHLPIFVILPGKRNTSRSVRLGWVRDFDDVTGQFLILFGEEPPAYDKPAETDAPFALEGDDDRREGKTKVRPSQQQFRFQVLGRYGCKCAVCDISHPNLIKAAHIRGKADRGSDDWRNGLPLCSTHHDAFDAYLFAVEPKTRAVRLKRNADAKSIGLQAVALSTERNYPHVDALEWRWNVTQRRWSE